AGLRGHPALGASHRPRRRALRDDLPRDPVPRAGLGWRQRPAAGLPGQDARVRTRLASVATLTWVLATAAAGGARADGVDRHVGVGLLLAKGIRTFSE